MNDKFILVTVFGLHITALLCLLFDYCRTLKERRDLRRDLAHAYQHIKRLNKEIDYLETARMEAVVELVTYMADNWNPETDN